MTAFAPIRAAAEKRLGRAALEARLPAVKTADELRAVPDDRYLSLMALRIFRAGLKHSVVDAKWPAFEDAFLGFDPRRVRAMSDEAIEALMSDTRLIRHLGKLRAVHANAAALLALAEEKGSLGAHLAAWPGSDIIGLWDDLARRFQQLGGNSAALFLRMAGKDSFVLTEAVGKALVHWRVLAAPPKGKAERAAIQAAFNAWVEEARAPLAHLSMTLAASID